MNDIICPLDGSPCAKDCPDRYVDNPEGGCVLTTMMKHADAVIIVRRSAHGQQ